MVPSAQTVVVFVSRRSAHHDEEYQQTAERMELLARSQPGFIDMVSVRDPLTREGITVAYFEDDESARAWKAHPEHLAAQQRGVVDFYESYDVTVGTITRRYGPSTEGDKTDGVREGVDPASGRGTRA